MSASLQSPCARLQESSHTATSTLMRLRSVRGSFGLKRLLGLTSTGFPIALLLIGMIYTSTWALKFLSIPVYTIFKNLTIILIAYGEVLWFGGSVTPMALFSFGLMVFSSIIAAWADIQHALSSVGHATEAASEAVSTLHAGYLWMMFNCICSATFVLCMRKRIKLTNFKDFDSTCGACDSLSNMLTTASYVLQQSPHHPHPPYCVHPHRGLVSREHPEELSRRSAQRCYLRHGFVRSLFGLYLLHFRLGCARHNLNNVLDGRCPQQAPHRA